MMKMTPKLKLTLFLLIGFLVASCATQAPIAVYVTPTLQPSQSLSLSETTSDVVDLPSGSASGFTLTSMQTGPTVEPHPTVTWLGPVVGPGYSLPPSSTPQPTLAPTTVPGQPSATSAPAASPAPQGTATLYPAVMPNLDPTKMGIQVEGNLDQADWDEVMRRVSGDQLNLGWIKLQIAWKDLQPNGPGEISPFFQRIIFYMQDAQRHKLHILLSIAKAPAWARSTQDQDGPPDDPQTYATFLTQLIGQLQGAVDAIEIWNEPNLSSEWTGKLPFSGAGYMQLFDAGYKAIRAASPSLTIVTAGLSPTGDSSGTVDDRKFLQQMYAAGLGNYHDIAIGVHPYGWANPPDATCCGTKGWDNDPHFFFGDTLNAYHQMMDANGQSNQQLWVTEFGWPTWDGFPGQPPAADAWITRNTKWDQANYAIRAFQIGQQTPYIGPMFLWNLNFALLAGMVKSGDEQAAYSIVIPGQNEVLDPNSTVDGPKGITERPLYWMIYDAVRPNTQLPSY